MWPFTRKRRPVEPLVLCRTVGLTVLLHRQKPTPVPALAKGEPIILGKTAGITLTRSVGSGSDVRVVGQVRPEVVATLGLISRGDRLSVLDPDGTTFMNVRINKAPTFTPDSIAVEGDDRDDRAFWED